MSKAKKLKAALILLAVAAAAVLIVVLLSRLEDRLAGVTDGAGTAPSLAARAAAQTEAPSSPGSHAVADSITYNGRSYVLNDELSVLLLLGIDDYEVEESSGARNDGLADFLTVAVFRPSDSTVTLLQLNRDTMTDVPVLDEQGAFDGYAFEQLALAHVYGSGLQDSCENTVNAVSLLLGGIPIDNYVSFTMGAIPVLNDLAGGVTVMIEDDFTGVDDSLVQGQEATLKGAQAETFVRSRMNMADDPTNIARMRRQRTYMTALIAALRAASAEDDGFVLNAYGAVADYIVTDCSLDEINAYAKLSNFSLSSILTPEGESVAGERLMEFYVDEDALRQLVIDLFYLPAEE